MKIHFYHMFNPEGVPVYRSDSAKGAQKMARQLSAIMGAWPLSHVNGASWPLFTWRKIRY